MELMQPLILLTIGIGLIAIPLKLFPKYERIKKSGLPAEGIIFDLIESRSSNSYHQYPVVRFLTAKDEWITQKYEIGISLNRYRKGQKVHILYDPSKPEDFIIKSGSNEIILYTLVVAGIILTGIAAFLVIRSI